jgi:hypothetical protein
MNARIYIHYETPEYISDIKYISEHRSTLEASEFDAIRWKVFS